MIETQAVVMKTEDSVAYVQAERKSSCSGCSESNCGTSVLANFFGQKAPLYRANNELGAKVGERVMVGLEESALFKGTLLLYMFPILLLFAGAVTGGALAATADAREACSVAGAVIGLAAGFLWLKIFSARIGLGKKFQPVILSRIDGVPLRFVEFESGLKK
ncbi:MAG: SoxR reducing system RseC family protein [Gammaproteobacteria bacterium]|nr:SoxR reducing system RseC family protein [Gammaproteobacteria bacterium]